MGQLISCLDDIFALFDCKVLFFLVPVEEIRDKTIDYDFAIYSIHAFCLPSPLRSCNILGVMSSIDLTSYISMINIWMGS